LGIAIHPQAIIDNIEGRQNSRRPDSPNEQKLLFETQGDDGIDF